LTHSSAICPAVALERFQAAGVADRAVIKTGPFFEEVPGGGDLYVLKHVVRDWDDEEVR